MIVITYLIWKSISKNQMKQDCLIAEKYESILQLSLISSSFSNFIFSSLWAIFHLLVLCNPLVCSCRIMTSSLFFMEEFEHFIEEEKELFSRQYLCHLFSHCCWREGSCLCRAWYRENLRLGNIESFEATSLFSTRLVAKSTNTSL